VYVYLSAIRIPCIWLFCLVLLISVPVR
jgi:hypothetical protein